MDKEVRVPDGSLGPIPKFCTQFIAVPGFSVTLEDKDTGKFYVIKAREISREEFDRENEKADAMQDAMRIIQNPNAN